MSRGERKRGTMTVAGRKEETEENEGVHDQEVGIGIIIIIITVMKEKEDGGGLVPVLDPGPRVQGAGAGTAELVWKNLPSLLSLR